MIEHFNLIPNQSIHECKHLLNDWKQENLVESCDSNSRFKLDSLLNMNHCVKGFISKTSVEFAIDQIQILRVIEWQTFTSKFKNLSLKY